MGTITINVSDETEDIFRKTVYERFGKGKGILGKALEEAIKKWSEEKQQKQAEDNLLRILKKGYNLGGLTYKKRAELYDR